MAMLKCYDHAMMAINVMAVTKFTVCSLQQVTVSAYPLRTRFRDIGFRVRISYLQTVCYKISY